MKSLRLRRIYRHDCFTTRKIHTKPHPGLEWGILHILTSEDIDYFIGFSSKVFGNLWKMFGNVRVTFGQVLENLWTSSETGRKSWEKKILCFRGKTNISRVSAANELDIVTATRT